MTDAFSKWFESAAVAGRSWTNRELAEGAFRAFGIAVLELIAHACSRTNMDLLTWQ